MSITSVGSIYVPNDSRTQEICLNRCKHLPHRRPTRTTMPVPWEALIPFGLVTFFFGVSGTLLNVSTRAQNLGKPLRYNIDNWDEMMMRRDDQLTGHRRGQRVRPHTSFQRGL
ncbi:hypothetical protein E1B28_004820 [Marasmius oreades]|uniref:NADH dehydrogenase [ubiquinone] 1 alpha subcomplex subunit 1 n=1 Tax=Marasmius oreades TaxID=181124 RepID=A0A9P7UZF2_9AGAR|nr:uncharacterized protein E1B28_004820 [Marasmius oreades]KAG7097478.1 hypothetical protein E1B28_004820 [Marasmius oreades]